MIRHQYGCTVEESKISNLFSALLPKRGRDAVYLTRKFRPLALTCGNGTLCEYHGCLTINLFINFHVNLLHFGPASFWSFLTFLHHGIEKVERHLLWKFHKKLKEKLVKCATKVARLHRVSIQSCTQNGRLRKIIRTQEIEFNFFISWTIFMKLGTLVHHVHGYKICLRFFNFCLGT